MNAQRLKDGVTQQGYRIPMVTGHYPQQEVVNELIRAYMDGNIVVCDPNPRCYFSEYGKEIPEESNARIDEHHYVIGESEKYGTVYSIETVVRARGTK